MKKICIILILCISFSSLFAMQTGIKLGYNSSNFIPSQQTNMNMPGFRLGGFSQLPLGSLFLQSEVLLTSKGFSSISIGDTRLSNLFLYLELPVSIKYQFLQKNTWDAYVLGGCFADLKIIAINLVSELDGIRNIDAGVHVGMGLGFEKMELEIRYQQSLVNFDLVETEKFHWTFSAGMNFYLCDK